MPVRPNSPTISQEFTRPADTNAYAALDVISTSTTAPALITFTGVGRFVGANGYLTRLKIQTNLVSVTPRLRLHLYRVAPTAINDNAPFSGPLHADRAKYIGYLDSGALAQEGTGADSTYAENISDRLQFDCDPADVNLYGILETLDAFTPGNAEVFRIELGVERNW